MAEASVTMLPQNYVELTAEEDLTNISMGKGELNSSATLRSTLFFSS